MNIPKVYYLYRCRDCGWEWEQEETDNPCCPTDDWFCGSPNVEKIAQKLEDGEWYSFEPFDDCDSDEIANDPLR